MKAFLITLTALLSLSLFAGCKSFSQPASVVKPLDYTDKDVVENEKNTIHNLMDKEPVKALFRACLLGDEEIFEECWLFVNQKAEEAEEKGLYLLALKYFKSLQTAASSYNASIEDKEIKLKKIDTAYKKTMETFYKDVPGYNLRKEKLPSSITECINASLTVWVDQGYKVENGAGYADIVIGSGFFIDSRGYIITNYHVIAELVNPKRKTACKLYVKLPSDMEKKIPARLIGYDSIMDLALLKIETEPLFVFELGESSTLHLGDKISVIGTPIGLEGTLTSGIISSTSRNLLSMGSVFQLDAAVNSGNSGGPLIDKDNKVQAVVFAGVLQSQGLNFAIPVEYLKALLPQLYRGEEVLHGWLGAYGHTKKQQNENLGVEIQYVIPGSSASFSGLQIDDLITKVDGVQVQSLEALQLLLMKYEMGTMLTCSCLRDGIERQTLLYLEKRPEAPLKEAYKSDFVDDSFIPIFGIKMVRSSTTNKKLYRIEYVIEGSTADQNGFSENDQLELVDLYLDDKNEMLYAVIVIQRKKHGLLDIQMGLAASYDNPNYF